ncbi:MAG TPA: dihydroneopterin aldolase [Kofleriaceae bacterium]|nr:dihydroneopterin aldolase [Kofleriaceae bacterium]
MVASGPRVGATQPADRPAEHGDSVFVRGLEFEASHGYTAAERRATRRFRVSLELRHPLRVPAQSDRLPDTVDYRRVCEIVVRIGTESTTRLLERLAARIAESIQEAYPRAEITVELEKLAPPCPGCPESCGVRMTFPALR